MGIDKTKAVLMAAVNVVNAEQTLVATDWKGVMAEMLDAGDEQIAELVAAFKTLDLTNDQLEATIERAVESNQKYLVLFLRLLKIVMPKKP